MRIVQVCVGGPRTGRHRSSDKGIYVYPQELYAYWTVDPGQATAVIGDQHRIDDGWVRQLKLIATRQVLA